MSAIQSYSFLVLTCFGADIDRVSSAAFESLEAHDLRRRFSVSRAEASPRKVYSGAPTPGGAHSKRALFFEPVACPGTTVLFADMEDGWWTLVNATAARVLGTHAQIRLTQGDKKYPLRSFEVWSDRRSKRAVSCAKDDRGKWEFANVGEPLEFEDQRSYTKHRIADRLTPRMIVTYMSALGWDIEGPQFWHSNQPGVYLDEVRTQA